MTKMPEVKEPRLKTVEDCEVEHVEHDRTVLQLCLPDGFRVWITHGGGSAPPSEDDVECIVSLHNSERQEIFWLDRVNYPDGANWLLEQLQRMAGVNRPLPTDRLFPSDGPKSLWRREK